MALKLFKILLQRFHTPSRKQKMAGFTVLELLMATLIATFVLIVLMEFIIDLLQTDRREYARNETQREMQMALDYIVNDLREAAYVYDQPGVEAIKTYLPSNFAVKKFEPILAFWKPETIPDSDLSSLNCNGFVQPQQSQCNLLKIKRRAYSLVVYLLVRNDENNTVTNGVPKWKGMSRILRYQLNKYQNIANLQQSVGYVDPSENTVSFQTWPLNSNGISLQTSLPSDQNRPVLVDFVDFPYTPRPDGLADPDNTNCPDTTNYSRIPPENHRFNNPSFMVCVSKSTVNLGTGTGTNTSSTNQDVLIFLRGNPTGKAGVKVAPLLAVKTQAVARGVIDKRPQ